MKCNGYRLLFDGKETDFKVSKVDIPELGYVKVPRISTILLKGTMPVTTQTLTWYYPSRFGDNAVRVRQVDEVNEKWHWSSWQWLKNDAISQPFSLTEVFTQQTVMQVVQTYIFSDFEHILPKGLDHILLFQSIVKTMHFSARLLVYSHL